MINLPLKKMPPAGVWIIGGLFTFVGGFTTFVLALEIIDSLRWGGLSSLLIVDYTSLGGFLLYGVTPLLFYSVGLGLIFLKEWARLIAVFLMPVLTLSVCLHLAYKQTVIIPKWINTPQNNYIFMQNVGIFLKYLAVFVSINIPIVVYLRNPSVLLHFEST